MAELLPALEARGETVSIYCGTSVGAINVAMLASQAGRHAAEQAETALTHWREMRKGDVIRPIVGPGLAVTAIRAVGDALDLPGVSLASVLDPAPLRRSVEHWVDWQALRANVRQGKVEAVCVLATSLERGGPVAFVETCRKLPARRSGDGLRFEKVSLTGEHVRASAAIPMLFPPVEVTTPRAVRGHYIDGATRLNTPIKPALALGADRVVVVGLEPFGGGDRPRSSPHRPHLAEVAANVVDGLLVDQVADDLHRMLTINSFFAEHAGGGTSPAARAYRRSRGKPPYRRIAYALVSPGRRGEIARIAENVFERRFGGLRGLRAPDYPLLARLLGGRGRSRGELLSFLLFDRDFTEELIAAGRRDARRWLDAHPGFWCLDPAHDLNLGSAPEGTAALHEEIALDEWRTLRRR